MKTSLNKSGQVMSTVLPRHHDDLNITDQGANNIMIRTLYSVIQYNKIKGFTSNRIYREYASLTCSSDSTVLFLGNKFIYSFIQSLFIFARFPSFNTLLIEYCM